MSSTINHPLHYGGDTIYETIKVLEAWLTPEQFIGFCRGNAIKYSSRADKKGAPAVDIAKAEFYNNYENDFRARLGIAMTGEARVQSLAVKRVFWTVEEPEPVEHAEDLVNGAPELSALAIMSNVAPHCQWIVRSPVGDGKGGVVGYEVETFLTASQAEHHVNRLIGTRLRQRKPATGKQKAR